MAELHKGDKTEVAQITVTRDVVDKIVEMQHEKLSKVELSEKGELSRALAICQGAKALLSVTSKEKAKEAMYKGVYDYAYMEGRKAGEMRGNPKDLDSLHRYEAGSMESAAFIPYIETLEETETYTINGIKKCPWAESIRTMAEIFPDYVTQDVIEVVTSRCVTLDSGRVNGFNPDIKFERTHFILDDMLGKPPSDGCFFKSYKVTD